MSIYGYKILFSIGSIATGTHVPISSASARLRSGAPSYLQVVIPDYHTWVDVIVNPAIDLYLYKKIIGTGTWELITWVDCETIRTDIGARNKSITLSGHRTYTPAAVGAVLQDYSYISTGARTTIRCSIINSPVPGGNVIAGTHANITAEQVTYTINSRQASIEISGT
jgi:hypothetical protein